MNSLDECNVLEKAARLSVIVYDNKLNNSNDEAFSINTVCNCRSRFDKFIYFNRSNRSRLYPKFKYMTFIYSQPFIHHFTGLFGTNTVTDSQLAC